MNVKISLSGDRGCVACSAPQRFEVGLR
jgi:hypothetical protein